MTIADIVPVTGEATNAEIFSCAEFGNLTVLEIDNEPWFVGKEVAEKLGYENKNRDIVSHVEDEDRFMLDKTQYGNSIEFDYKTLGQRGGWLINESGLYSLVLSSKLESSKRFKRWVTKDILPTIRKHGMYATEELLDNPDLLIQVATQLKEEKQRNKLLQEQNEAMKPKAIFAEAVASSSQSILIRELAKLIKQNGVDIGEKRLFAHLREGGYLIKQGADKNLPTQKSMNLGLMEIKETVINNPDGTVRLSRTTKITGKGQTYFINKFLNS